MLSPTWQVYMAHVQQKRLHPRALHAVQTTRIHTQTHTQNNKHILIRYYLHLRHKRRQMLQMCLLTWYWESLSATSQHYGQARTHTHTHTHTHTLSHHIAGGLLPVWVRSGWNCSLSTWCCPHYTDVVLTAIHLVCRVLKSLNGCQECSTQTYIWPALWTSVCVCACVRVHVIRQWEGQ